MEMGKVLPLVTVSMWKINNLLLRFLLLQRLNETSKNQAVYLNAYIPI